jgi:hypothetical protein
MNGELRMVTSGRVAELWLGSALFGIVQAEDGGVVLRLESVARGQRVVDAEALERALIAARQRLLGHPGDGTVRVHAPPAAEPMALEEFIADVLRLSQECGTAEVAALFADELAKSHPHFDRARFLEAVGAGAAAAA